MNTIRLGFGLAALAVLSNLNPELSTCFAQGTAFTYQGRLNSGTEAATGSYDLTFTLFGSSSGGGAVAGPVTNSAVTITNGLFTVLLDFGANFPGADRWLEIGVRSNATGAFTALSPRQQIASAPYAITAGNLTGTLPAAQLTGNLPASQLSGTLTLGQLPGALLTNNQSGVNLTGNFSGNGFGLTNADIARLTSWAIAWGNFLVASRPGVGFSPNSVVAADVNGDGKLDLISANYDAGTLSVLTNDGTGGFALASSLTVGSNPYSVAAADVNGDGKVDVISANYSDNTLSILTNDGSGGFVLASSPGVGSNPESVVAADVNGDGKVDLISANSFDNTLSILTNNGTGGFALASSPGAGNQPVSVVAADVNSDGKVDLVAADHDFNIINGTGFYTLTVLTNNGSGGFVLASLPGVGSVPVSVAAADVNGDGKVDLISANSGSDTLSVLTNDGSGAFVLASTYSPGGGFAPLSIAAADVNGDGKVDLIIGDNGVNGLSVLTNDGSGGFALASERNLAVNPASVAAADLNGDGKVDLICASGHFGSTLVVLFNTPTFTGNFTGNGGGLTNLNATNLSGSVPSTSLTSVPAESLTGTVADARLSANVALLDVSQTFSGANTFNNSANSFTGNGAGIDRRIARSGFSPLHSKSNRHGSVRGISHRRKRDFQRWRCRHRHR